MATIDPLLMGELAAAFVVVLGCALAAAALPDAIRELKETYRDG